MFYLMYEHNISQLKKASFCRKFKTTKQYCFSSPHKGREASKDIYIEVAPGTYSVTATSEDMVKQTHVVDITAGQSIDLTFSL